MNSPDVPDLSHFANLATMRGGDPDLVREEILNIIELVIQAHPRSHQVEMGPSEIGHPCVRWLAYRLAGAPTTGTELPPWRQTVGTGVHDLFTRWMLEANETITEPRWWPDLRVDVGELLPGRHIVGNTDLYDRVTATVVDLKCPGPTAMKTAAHGGPERDQQYRAQVHLYGRGVVRAGLPVDNVAVLRLPAAGELAQAKWSCEPYDEQVAVDALARAGTVAGLVDQLGVAAATVLPATDHHCHRCQFFRPGSTDLSTGCPGAENRIIRSDPLHQLIA
jgi:hypothetical protein